MGVGPVKHVVLFKFKDGVTEGTIAELIQGYKDLPGKIEGMKHFEWGADVSVENLTEGYTHCFITTFADAAARDAYIPHPEHKKYVEVLFPNLEKVLVIDFVPEVVK
ncbi:MAG: hypothetical protein AMXMBFR4_31160 [Candidatus Hydrogenedentota bacterium]